MGAAITAVVKAIGLTLVSILLLAGVVALVVGLISYWILPAAGAAATAAGAAATAGISFASWIAGLISSAFTLPSASEILLSLVVGVATGVITGGIRAYRRVHDSRLERLVEEMGKPELLHARDLGVRVVAMHIVASVAATLIIAWLGVHLIGSTAIRPDSVFGVLAGSGGAGPGGGTAGGGVSFGIVLLILIVWFGLHMLTMGQIGFLAVFALNKAAETTGQRTGMLVTLALLRVPEPSEFDGESSPDPAWTKFWKEQAHDRALRGAFDGISVAGRAAAAGVLNGVVAGVLLIAFSAIHS